MTGTFCWIGVQEKQSACAMCTPLAKIPYPSLQKKAGFKVIESFYSDGKEGDLALYQIWQKEQL